MGEGGRYMGTERLEVTETVLSPPRYLAMKSDLPSGPSEHTFCAISSQLRNVHTHSILFSLPWKLYGVLVLNGFVQDGGWSPNHF